MSSTQSERHVTILVEVEYLTTDERRIATAAELARQAAEWLFERADVVAAEGSVLHGR